MLLHEIKTTSGIQVFSAEIDADEGSGCNVKNGLAVLWAIERGIKLRGCSFAGGVYLNGADISNTNFSMSSLAGSTFVNCNLTGANFSNCKLNGLQLSGCKADRCNFTSADLTGADFGVSELNHVNFNRAVLNNCNLNSMKIIGANFRHAIMTDDFRINSIPFSKPPIQIQDDQYNIYIWDGHFMLDCALYSIGDWYEKTDRDYLCIDGRKAVKMRDTWIDNLRAIAEKTGRLH